MAFSWPQIACCAFSHHKLRVGGGVGSAGEGGRVLLPAVAQLFLTVIKFNYPKPEMRVPVKLGLTASCASDAQLS